MTARDLLDRGGALLAAARPGATRALRWAWDHRTLVLAVLVVLLAAVSLRSCRRASTAEAGAAAAEKRAAGEARAEAAGIPVAHVVPQAVVDETGERAKAENPLLRAKVDELEERLGKTRLELAARIRTEAAPSEVAIAKGDPLRLDADLQVREKEGAHLLVGTLAAWRGPDLVVRQPYSAPVTVAVTTSPPGACPALEDRAWRAGPVGGASGGGWLAGGAYARRVDVWGARPEGIVAGAAGPGGVALLGGVLF